MYRYISKAKKQTSTNAGGQRGDPETHHYMTNLKIATDFSTFKGEKIKCELIGSVQFAKGSPKNFKGEKEMARLTWGFGSIQCDDFDNFKEAMKIQFAKFTDSQIPVCHRSVLKKILINGTEIDELTNEQLAAIED